MKRNKSRQSGITLVSLVITIIILLILAGVAINMVTNSDGLFAHVNTAVTKWNQSVANEEAAIQNIIDQTEEIINGGGTEPDIPPEEPDLPEDWEASKVADVITETSEVTGITKKRKAPVPTGYVASQIPGENTIEGGLVIYEGSEPVSGDKNSDSHTNAMTTRNQYVWIPVDDINQMVMCKSNTENSVCNLVIQANGTLKCEEHNSEELWGRLYGMESTYTTVDGKKIGNTAMNFVNRNQIWTASGNREPDMVSAKDTDATTGNLETFTTNMTNDFKTMAKSVATYGGFYVSRYEVGAGGSSKKGQAVLTAAEDSAKTWYGLYNTLRGTNKHMIWGSQYDQIVHFTDEEGDQTGHIDRQTTTLQVSGYEGDTDIMKNIYDLEGNLTEWTAEADDTNIRVNRGGCYNSANVGNIYSVSYCFNSNPDVEYGRLISSRSTLYL